MSVIRAAITVAVLSLAVSCGGSDASTTGPGSGGTPVSAATVRATPAIQFTPATVNLTVGGTVTFAFGAVDHNLFFDGAPAGAPANITAPTHDASVTRTFPTAGRFVFNCHIHPGMTGTIIVQ
jgi:plastocyanin